MLRQDPFDRENDRFPFTTTGLNRFFYWVSNLVLCPTYTLSVYFVWLRGLALFDQIGDPHLLACIGALATGLLLYLFKLLTNPIWRKGRGWLFVGVSGAWLFWIVWSDEPFVFELAIISWSLIWLLGVIEWYRVGHRRPLRIGGILVLVILSMLIGALVARWLRAYTGLTWLDSFAFFVSIGWLFGLMLIDDDENVLKRDQTTLRKSSIPNRLKQAFTGLLKLAIVIGEIIIVGVMVILSEPSVYRGWLALAAFVSMCAVYMVWLYNQPSFLSNVRTDWRAWLAPVRHGQIRAFASPMMGVTNAALKTWQYGQGLLKRYWGQLAVGGALISGNIAFLLVVRLYLYATDQKTPDLPTLFSLGLASNVIVSALCFVGWGIFTAPRHLVLPFTAPEEDPDLQRLARSATYGFVEQMRHIGVLLNLRQTENTNADTKNPLTLFVTSHSDETLASQVRSLSIETEILKLPLGYILSLWSTALAYQRIRGVVNRGANGTVELWIEFSERNGQTIAVGTTLATHPPVTHIEDWVLNAGVRQLAIELVMRLGQNAHLGSSWESLKDFLEGLEAGYRQNWWKAILNYRRAIHREEALRGSFALGHYHLGTALILRGTIEKGLNHLRAAEATDPLPETQYMIGLTILNQHWYSLHKRARPFEDILQRCKLALTLRQDFAEAYHLLGTAHYRLSVLLKRHPKETLAEAFNAPEYYLTHATRYFRLALHSYQTMLQALPTDVIAQHTVYDERHRLLADYTQAAHQLGDTLREQHRYAEADSYYADVETAFPGMIRNLIDRAKNYCLAGNWQVARIYIRRNVFNRLEARRCQLFL